MSQDCSSAKAVLYILWETTSSLTLIPASPFSPFSPFSPSTPLSPSKPGFPISPFSPFSASVSSKTGGPASKITLKYYISLSMFVYK